MSEIIVSQIGRFRRVVDSENCESFLFECPRCREWLPMSTQHLSGALAPVHFENPSMMPKRSGKPTICAFQKQLAYGATLVAAIQANLLMTCKPYDDESET